MVGKNAMEYNLRFSISSTADDIHWNRETHEEDEHGFYIRLIEKLKIQDAKIEDFYGHVDFRNGTPELASRIKAMVEKEGYHYGLWALPRYSPEDISRARYVNLAGIGDEVDMDDSGKLLNEYKEILCTTCGRTNDSNVPSPYNIYNKRVKQPRDLFRATNGVKILSILAFELLRSEIEPWVNFGQVRIVDKQRKPVESACEYVWIRPTHQVGKFVNARAKRACNKCGCPTEIPWERSEDIFERDKWVVESFNSVQAPIVLAGNWYGEIYPHGLVDLSRYVFISGSLHEKMRKLKLKGFVKSDCVVHAADEPYEWDPLKDYKPITSDCSR
jgi:hypothetical protein